MTIKFPTLLDKLSDAAQNHIKFAETKYNADYNEKYAIYNKWSNLEDFFCDVPAYLIGSIFAAGAFITILAGAVEPKVRFLLFIGISLIIICIAAIVYAFYIDKKSSAAYHELDVVRTQITDYYTTHGMKADTIGMKVDTISNSTTPIKQIIYYSDYENVYKIKKFIEENSTKNISYKLDVSNIRNRKIGIELTINGYQFDSYEFDCINEDDFAQLTANSDIIDISYLDKYYEPLLTEETL